MGLFDDIRSSCSAVAEKAKWVSINDSELMMYPERLLHTDEEVHLEHTPEHHFLGRGDETLKYFIILDTVNFGSGYFPFLDKNAGVSGYFTVAERLSRYVAKNGIPSPDSLVVMNASECARIFEQKMDSKHTEELMSLFAMALQQLGSWLIEKYEGNYLGFLEQADSAEGAVRSLRQMRFYNDSSDYFGVDVLFLKRAQILLQDIRLAEPEHPLIQYEDIDELTVFADNVLPYVFRLEGITQYDPWIDSRIANDELIASGSSEEIELRACAVTIGERLAEVIRDEIRPISVRELDYLLWLRGQKLKKHSDLKRHRCRCVFY